LRPLLATFDREKGMGASNRGRYANPEMDKVLVEALATVDDAKRGALLAKATEIAMDDVGIIPTHFQLSVWATRKGLKITPRPSEYTLVTGVTEE
jgi:peptide/nickel transport system substrate-binding protein